MSTLHTLAPFTHNATDSTHYTHPEDSTLCVCVCVCVCGHLFVLLGQGLHLQLELVVTVVESLDLLLHLPLLVLCVGDLQEWLDLGEQPPPLPVPQLQVALHVALDDADGAELLHTLLVSPESREREGEERVCTILILGPRTTYNLLFLQSHHHKQATPISRTNKSPLSQN